MHMYYGTVKFSSTNRNSFEEEVCCLNSTKWSLGEISRSVLCVGWCSSGQRGTPKLAGMCLFTMISMLCSTQSCFVLSLQCHHICLFALACNKIAFCLLFTYDKIKKIFVPAKVVRKLDHDSYEIITSAGATYRRTRRFLRERSTRPGNENTIVNLRPNPPWEFSAETRRPQRQPPKDTILAQQTTTTKEATSPKAGNNNMPEQQVVETPQATATEAFPTATTEAPKATTPLRRSTRISKVPSRLILEMDMLGWSED